MTEPQISVCIPSRIRNGGILLVLIAALLSGCTTETPATTAASVTESPGAEATPRPVEGKMEGPILFIPLGDVDKNAVQTLATHFEKKLKLDIDVLEEKDGNVEDFGATESLDTERKQLKGAEFLEKVLPYTEASPQNPALPEGNLSKYRVIIAITNQDLYNNKRPEKDFLFSVGSDSKRGYLLGVISQKRLDPAFYQKKPDAKVTQERLQKLVMKQIGRFYYGKTGSSDPSSVMYDGISSVADVDRMKEKF